MLRPLYSRIPPQSPADGPRLSAAKRNRRKIACVPCAVKCVYVKDPTPGLLRLMDRLHPRYPGYGWDHNRGYATEDHREAIRRLGPPRAIGELIRDYARPQAPSYEEATDYKQRLARRRESKRDGTRTRRQLFAAGQT